MKKYDEYKDSGVAWIGEVPKHWEVLRGKYVLNILSGFPFDSQKFEFEDNGVYMPLIRIRDINGSSTEVYYSGSYPIESVVKTGEVLIGMDGDFNISKWKGTNALLNQRVCKLREDSSMNTHYAFYMLSSPLKAINSVTYATTVKHLSVYDIYNAFIPVPPISEQTAIATYLDTHCAKIDNLISIQQKRIALLQELKQSVITHAVTKGLNPNVEMKQSGVEWIGDVPKHWEVMPIKYIADTNSGATPKNIKGRQNERSDIKWVRTTDLSDICDYVYDSSEYLSREEMKSASCPWLPKNTVVVAMYGGSGTIGKAGILGCDSTINQALCSLETTKLEDYRYLYYNIKSLRPYWMKLAASSRKDPNISQEIIRNMDVPVPGIDEQTKIVQYLDRKCTTINTSISNAQHQIDLLQEYKQSLITEVVTGKRKVTDN